MKNFGFYNPTTSDLQTKVIVASSTITYVGYSLPGVSVTASGWQVRRIKTTTDGGTEVVFANNDNGFVHIMANYATSSWWTNGDLTIS
jgi:hypothetical protein